MEYNIDNIADLQKPEDWLEYLFFIKRLLMSGLSNVTYEQWKYYFRSLQLSKNNYGSPPFLNDFETKYNIPTLSVALSEQMKLIMDLKDSLFDRVRIESIIYNRAWVNIEGRNYG